MEGMNQTELLIEETTQKMLYKIIHMIDVEIKNNGSLESLEEKLTELAN